MMDSKWIGAILIVAGCGGFGWTLSGIHRREVTCLRQLIRAVAYMRSELRYSVRPLPELCSQTSKLCSGIMRDVFITLTRELNWQIAPDAYSCMLSAIRKCPDLSARIKKLLSRLGQTLGQFDLEGQIRELDAMEIMCEGELKQLEANKEIRMRSYQTLGLCAGAALAILFM